MQIDPSGVDTSRAEFNRLGSPAIGREREKMIGVGKIKQYSNVLDKPLSKGKQEVLKKKNCFIFFCLFSKKAKENATKEKKSKF